MRARDGYVAPDAAATAATTASQLTVAMAAGSNSSGLQIRAHVAPMAAAAKGVTSVVAVEVTYPPSPDGLREISDTLKLSVVAVDADAKIKASSERTFEFKATPRAATDLTFLLDDAIDLPSQALTLRIGVASDALGTDAIHALVPFQPTTIRTFAASDTLRIYGRLFWPAKDGAADVTVYIRGAASPAPQTLHLAPPTDGASPGAAIDATLPLAGLHAGRYVLEINARLPNGRTAARAIPLEIE